jgi:hypothetical protein
MEWVLSPEVTYQFEVGVDEEGKSIEAHVLFSARPERRNMLALARRIAAFADSMSEQAGVSTLTNG